MLATKTEPRWHHANRTRTTAEELLRDVGGYQVPVPIIRVAKELGLAVFDISGWPDEVSGEIDYDGRGTPEIHVNEDHHEHRQRFTIAHEIGHAILHLTPGKRERLPRDTSSTFRDDATSPRKEREANRYAADLLIPNGLLRRYGPMYLWDESLLAAAFKVSPLAMKIRLQRYFLEHHGR